MEDVVTLVGFAANGGIWSLAEAAVGLYGVKDGLGEVEGQLEALDWVPLLHGLPQEVRRIAKNVCVDLRHGLDVRAIFVF